LEYIKKLDWNTHKYWSENGKTKLIIMHLMKTI
jgi:hypothetical protein